MTTLRYDEAELIGELARLSVERRAAFAASCAERLFPAYAAFCARAGMGDHTALAGTLQQAWQHVLGTEMSVDQLREALSRCMALHPGGDGGPWVDEQAYAEDAASAIAYTLRGLDGGDPQEFAWAARVAHEAAAYFVIYRLGIESEWNVRVHPIVQRELSRQHRDLEELREAPADPRGLFVRLRDRARREAASVFGDES